MDCDWETNQAKHWHNTKFFCKVNNIDHCNDLSNTQEAKPTRNEVCLFYFELANQQNQECRCNVDDPDWEGHPLVRTWDAFSFIEVDRGGRRT